MKKILNFEIGFYEHISKISSQIWICISLLNHNLSKNIFRFALNVKVRLIRSDWIGHPADSLYFIFVLITTKPISQSGWHQRQPTKPPTSPFSLPLKKLTNNSSMFRNYSFIYLWGRQKNSGRNLGHVFVGKSEQFVELCGLISQDWKVSEAI